MTPLIDYLNLIKTLILAFEIPSLKKEMKPMLLIFLSLFALYAVTMPRTVTVEDSGNFILSCYFMGIAHQPGYPLYTLLGKLFTFIPWGSVACRVHLMSAFFAASSCVLIYWLCRLIFSKSASKIPALTAALAYGVSRTFWSQAIVAEVYTLNAFCFFLLLALCLAYNISGSRRLIKIIAFVYGLSLTNHWPLIQLSLPALLILLLPRYREILRQSLVLALFFLLGLTPYLYLFWRSQMAPLISFQGSLNTWQELWYFISRQNYSQLEASGSASWDDKFQFAWFFCQEALVQFTVLGGGLFLWGAARLYFQKPRLLGLSLAWAFLGSSFFLISLLHFDFDLFFAHIFHVYPLIPYGIMAIGIGYGLQSFWEFFRQKWPTYGTLLSCLLCCGFLVSVYGQNIAKNNRQSDTWAFDFAKATLESLEPQAIYLTHEDWDVGPLGYAHLIEGIRPDVTLYNDKSLIFSNRLFKAILPSRDDQKKALFDLIENTDRPVYYTNEIMPSPYPSKYCGFFRQVDKNAPEGAWMTFHLEPVIREYFEKIMSQKNLRDPWAQMHRRMIQGKMAATLTPLVFNDHTPSEKKETYRFLLTLATSHYLGKLRMVDMLYNIGSSKTRLMWHVLEKAEHQLSEEVHLGNQSRLPLMKARVKQKMGDLAAVEKYYLESIKMYPNKKNKSFELLHAYYLSLGKILKAKKLKKQYPNGF